MKWTITKLTASGSLGALSLVLELPASAIAIVSGVPLMGGVVNIFIAPTLDSLTALIVPTFGSVTIERVVIGVLSLPFALGGPPGFAPKVVIMIFQGLIIDAIFAAMRQNRRLASIVASSVSSIYYSVAFILTAKVFAVPGIEQTSRIFLSPLVVVGTIVAGGVSGLMAFFIYKKIESTASIRRIQGNI